MPSKHKNSNKMQHPRKGKQKGSRKMDVFRQPFDGNHPTVVLKSRSLIGATMTGGVFYEQFNLIPQLASASADILEQAKFYQSYRIISMQIHWFALNNVNY
jgi:hypothetical protein